MPGCARVDYLEMISSRSPLTRQVHRGEDRLPYTPPRKTLALVVAAMGELKAMRRKPWFHSSVPS